MPVVEKWAQFQVELLRIMYEHDRAVHLTPQDEMSIRRLENQSLLDTCLRQKRELAWMCGEPIEPIQHVVSGVHLQAVGGLIK